MRISSNKQAEEHKLGQALPGSASAALLLPLLRSFYEDQQNRRRHRRAPVQGNLRSSEKSTRIKQKDDVSNPGNERMARCEQVNK